MFHFSFQAFCFAASAGFSGKFFQKMLDEPIVLWYIVRASNAGVAQLVEQLICNQQVGGSSPSTSSMLLSIEYGRVPERPKGTDCKSVGDAFGGSNPPSPTRKSPAQCVGLFR